MQDQEQFMTQHSIACAVLGESGEGVVKKATVIISSPEALLQRKNIRLLRRLHESKISLVVYDECHCVSKW
jgi:superfamily II DNA helicase RecQ